MSYRQEFQSNNTDLQNILNTINTILGGAVVGDSDFIPTDSGSNTYKSKLRDNNIDLQRLLNIAKKLPDYHFYKSLIDFEYTENADGTVTLTSWKETLNGEPSTELVIPDNERIIL